MEDEKSTGECTEYTSSYSDFASCINEEFSTCGDDVTDRLRLVRFKTQEDSYDIDSCLYMDPEERERLWYLRPELSRMKTDIKETAVNIQLNYDEMVTALKESHVRAKFIAESGIDEETLESGSSILDHILPWSSRNVSGEACRGAEKSLLTRDRLDAAEEARLLVVDNPDASKEAFSESVASAYAQISRYAAIHALAVAQADEIAATAIRNEKEEKTQQQVSSRFFL